MERFRLLHLSDFHLGAKGDVTNVVHRAAYAAKGVISDVDLASLVPRSARESIFRPTSYDVNAAFAVAKFCYDHRKNYDAIIVTGDLATTGGKADLQVAADFLKQKYGDRFFDYRGRASLGGVAKKRYIIPGNHDRYANIAGLPGATEFDTFFEDLYPSGKKVYANFIQKGQEKIGLVFADFCLRSIRDVESSQLDIAGAVSNMFGRGNVYDDILEELKKETLSLKRDQPGITILWSVHFAPYECEDSLKLQNYPKLLSAAKALNVKLILCGHTHTRHVATWDGVHIACAGTACSMDQNPKHQLHIVDLRVDRGEFRLEHEDYHFSSTDGEFIRVDD